MNDTSKLYLADQAAGNPDAMPGKPHQWVASVRPDKKAAARQSATMLLGKIDVARSKLQTLMQSSLPSATLERLKGQYDALGLRAKYIQSSLQFPTVKIPSALLDHLHGGEEHHDDHHHEGDLHHFDHLLHEVDLHLAETSHERDRVSFSDPRVRLGGFVSTSQMQGFGQGAGLA